MPETDPICWKCGGELATLDVHPVKYRCVTCGHDLDARTAFNPTHAKAMNEAAEGLLEGKECPQERLQVIVQELLQHAAAAKAAVRLFPALFAAKAAGGMLGPMDPDVMGEMCSEVLQHAIWMTGQLNDALTALSMSVAIADEAREEWDKAPQGQKAGKLLIALSGRCPGYRADIDAIHALLAKHKAASTEKTQ